MANNPTSSPPQKPVGSDQIPIRSPSPATALQNPNNHHLSSPPMDLSSPRLYNPQQQQQPPQINLPSQQHALIDHQQIQMQQQQQQQQQQIAGSSNFQSQQQIAGSSNFQSQQQISGSSNFQSQQPQQQRPGSSATSHIARLQQQYGSMAAATAMQKHAGIYGGQVSFAGGSQAQQQQQTSQATGGLIGQVQLTNLQQQMLAQTRQKTAGVQGSQFHPSNSTGQGLQGMQSIGMIGSLGLKNGQLSSYSPTVQQRLSQGMRQLQSPQMQLSSQKVPGQGISQALSTSMGSQLPGMAQSGQPSMVQNPLSQPQWLKHTQMAMAAAGSPSFQLQQQQHNFQQQRQRFLQQQLQNSTGLNQRQLSQLVQQQSQLNAQKSQVNVQPQQHNLQVSQPALLQQHLPTLQTQQQQQQLQLPQQQSPRVVGSASQKSMSLTGSQPGTPASVTTPGDGSSPGTETGTHLGKRKIQDLVSQVDSMAKLDPEVEDLLLELADDFIDSVTTFACTLAKHRKSSVLEQKDLLLHLEKNWHLGIPGYEKEASKFRRKQMADDIHKRRIEMLLRDSSQPSIDSSSSKETPKQNLHESSIEGTMRPVGSDQLISAPLGTTMMKVPRF